MEKESFLWHRVSEQEKQKIKEDAKKIMDNFAKALEKIESKAKEARVERDEFERNEGSGAESDEKFRAIMFKNAPQKEEDCIKAERGKWVE